MQKITNLYESSSVSSPETKETVSLKNTEAQKLVVANNKNKNTSKVAKTKINQKSKQIQTQNNQIAHIDSENKNLLSQILERQNMILAYKRVKSNKGAPWIDWIAVEEFESYLQQNWSNTKQKIIEWKYKPKPVRRVDIPKPNGKGKRLLGIPTVMDRVIQQAVLQVVSPIYEQTFSQFSYGFRPKRSPHQAINQAKEFLEKWYKYVVDIDLEKFFDTVNHDKLMARLALTIKDKMLLKLIRRYLQSWVMIEWIRTKTEIWTPQWWNLSPLLANIVLDELDKELEERWHRFCRYADDLNIYVKSKRAWDRVLKSITEFIESKLRLKVNQDKSWTDVPSKRKFLGFTLYTKKDWTSWIRIAMQVKTLIKNKLRYLSKRSSWKNMSYKIFKINEYSVWLINYYGIACAKRFFEEIDQWLRRRLRMCYWKQWKKTKTKYKNLKKLWLKHQKAYEYANTRKSYWRISNSWILSKTLTNQFFIDQWLKSLSWKFKQLKLV
jgi:RNA-directed DNA polymerase